MADDASRDRQDLSEQQSRVIEHLRAAIQTRDADATAAVVTEAYQAGLHPAMGPWFIELANAPWHTRHEDVVGALQRLRPPEAVYVLEDGAMTKHDYLAYDEFNALARKCTWALADIGTPDAHAALARLAAPSDPQLADYTHDPRGTTKPARAAFTEEHRRPRRSCSRIEKKVTLRNEPDRPG